MWDATPLRVIEGNVFVEVREVRLVVDLEELEVLIEPVEDLVGARDDALRRRGLVDERAVVLKALCLERGAVLRSRVREGRHEAAVQVGTRARLDSDCAIRVENLLGELRVQVEVLVPGDRPNNGEVRAVQVDAQAVRNRRRAEPSAQVLADVVLEGLKHKVAVVTVHQAVALRGG